MKLKIFFLQGACKRDDRKPCIFEIHKILIHLIVNNQECNAKKVNCDRVYSAYILKPVLSGLNL